MTEVPEHQILTCNKLAMEWLRKGKLSKAEEYISKAQKMLTSRMKSKQTFHLWAITYNNLGCLFKRKGDLDKALKYLEMALEKEENFSRDVLNLAGIHLNMSAIFSQMNSHEVSLKHALAAKKVLLAKAEKDQNTWVSLVIAYQSAGFEQECLNSLDSARELYLKGWEVAQDHLGAFHSVTEKIKKNYQVLQKNSKQVKPGQNRSKTPSLLPKTSNISLASNKNVKLLNLKENPHARAESIKKLDTLDLLISEIELGKSESSTEVQSQSLGKPEGKLKQIRKIQFERLPRLEEKHERKERLEVSENFRIFEEEQFKIETDDDDDLDNQNDYEDDFHEDEESHREAADQMVIKELIGSRESPAKQRSVELCEKEKTQEVEETIMEIESEPAFKALCTKSFLDKEVQTEKPAQKDLQVQTNPSRFRRIAAVIIQKHWRDHKKRKDPDFFRYLSEVKSARLEAESALSKVTQLKLNYRSRSKHRSDEPVPRHSKIRV